jgi:hypothetical protein
MAAHRRLLGHWLAVVVTFIVIVIGPTLLESRIGREISTISARKKFVSVLRMTIVRISLVVICGGSTATASWSASLIKVAGWNFILRCLSAEIFIFRVVVIAVIARLRNIWELALIVAWLLLLIGLSSVADEAGQGV